jgi:hypothetical protein
MDEGDNLDALMIQISRSELLEMVTAMVNRAETLVNMRAPKVLVNQTIHRAEKFNKILKKSGYDHWTKEKFIDLKEKAQYENFQ